MDLLGIGIFNSDGKLTPLIFGTLYLTIAISCQAICGSKIPKNYPWFCAFLSMTSIRFHRSMTRPFFSKERISDFQLFDEHVKATLKLLRTRLQEGHAVDFQVSRVHHINSTLYHIFHK